jgi:hypothetical protein
MWPFKYKMTKTKLNKSEERKTYKNGNKRREENHSFLV